jgi:hypothetical protein
MFACRNAACFVLLFATLAAVPAAAQVDRASLTGSVKDTTDSVMPGVTVTLRHVATNGTTTLVTDRDGVYLAQGLLPGDYEVRAELQGGHVAGWAAGAR